MTTCAAPWYELNLSAPDDIASACCYYGGAKESFNGGNVDLSYYWNGPNMRALRRLQADPNPPTPNGCSGCFYLVNRPDANAPKYFDFDQARGHWGLSPAQEANWDLARQEYTERREIVECAPMRLYANFGYTCNLACKMCHQVPRRQHIDRFVTSESIYAWQDSLPKMLEVCVIGGEPFAMPEAVKFIRRFATDPTMESVSLSVFTNGTVHHKHLETLKQKRKLNICISLDSISGGFENIRVGGKWSLVERNLLALKEIIEKERPQWFLATNALVMKTGVPYLPEFARWHARHGIQTHFLDFINFRGTEDAFYAENLLDQPQLLDGVPGWEENFGEAIEVFRAAGQTPAAASLQHFYDRVLAARRDTEEARRTAQRRSSRNDLFPIIEADSSSLPPLLTFHNEDGTREPALDMSKSPPIFSQTRPGDFAFTEWKAITVHSGSVYRLFVEWPEINEDTRRAHVVCQSQMGNLDGFREFAERDGVATMRMSGPVPPGSVMLRVVVLPVGEEASVLPRRISLDVDQDTISVPIVPTPSVASQQTPVSQGVDPGAISVHIVATRSIASGWAAPVSRGAWGMISNSIRSLKRGATALVRRLEPASADSNFQPPSGAPPNPS